MTRSVKLTFVIDDDFADFLVATRPLLPAEHGLDEARGAAVLAIIRERDSLRASKPNNPGPVGENRVPIHVKQ
jgi:hypothetical protein